MGKIPPRPRARRIRKEVADILGNQDRDQSLALLSEYDDPSLVGPLFSFFYHMDDLIRFRSITAMGELTLRIKAKSLERAKIIMRRLMWNLNDESGGIGWGSCEAMGEILKQSPVLAKDFGSVLLSYLDPKGNFLEHDMLQRGVLWGVGTYVSAMTSAEREAITHIEPFLSSTDAIKRGYAVRALNGFKGLNYGFSGQIRQDMAMVPVFDGWNIIHTTVADIILRTRE